MKNRLQMFVSLFLIVLLLAACGNSNGNRTGTENPESSKVSSQSQTTAPSSAKSDYPSKPIRIYIPYSAGGAADLSVRALQPKLAEVLGQPVEVVAKPGGGGALSMNEVIKSRPDGYTLGFTGVGPAIITPITSDVGYTTNDFDTIAAHMDIPYVVAVPGDSPYRKLQDLLDDIKAKPNKIRIGTPGPTSTTFIALQDLSESQGLQFQSVPFNGGVDTINALLGKNLEAIVNVDSELKGYIDDGTFRILTVLSDKRSAVTPNTPTSAEQGLQFTIKAAPPSGLFAPKGTPPEIIAILSKAVKAATEDPGVKEKFNNISITPVYTSPEDFRKSLDESFAYYKKKLK